MRVYGMENGQGQMDVEGGSHAGTIGGINLHLGRRLGRIGGRGSDLRLQKTPDVNTTLTLQLYRPKVNCSSPHRHQPKAETKPPRILQEV